MGIFNKKDQSNGIGNHELLPPLLLGVQTILYTGNEPVDLDASMIEVYTKVKLEPGQKVTLPTMLARHWLKKSFFIAAE